MLSKLLKSKLALIIAASVLLVAVICGIIAGIIGGLKNKTVAEVPDPEEFFGIKARRAIGSYDIDLQFESEKDQTDKIEAYVSRILDSSEDIELTKVEGLNSVEYTLTYTGSFISEKKPWLRIFNYGNDYYSIDGEKYVFVIYADDNFKFIKAEDIKESKNDNKNNSDSQKTDNKTNNKTEEKPKITGPTLPDPSAFFGGISPQEDEKADVSGYHLYFKTDIDSGWTAAHEYVELLKNSDYKFKETEHKEDTILYLKNDMYFLEYTGKEDITPASDRYYEDGYVNFESDVFIWIQKNGKNEYTGVSIYFSDDLEVKDLGDRASTLTQNSNGNGNNSSPDFSVETPDHSKLPCLTCDGDKDCPECHGYGEVKKYSGKGETVDTICPTCRGRRKCPTCGGSGTRD